MRCITIDDKIEYVKSAILVCEEKILIGGDGSELWEKLRYSWKETLNDLLLEKNNK